MDSFLFCTSYFQKQGTHSGRRYNKWVNYYLPLMRDLDVDHLFLIDDGSSDIELTLDYDILIPNELPITLSKPVNCVCFPDNLGRSSVLDYPGWWRSFNYSLELARFYNSKKIIHIESDFFVISDSLKNYLRKVHSGWTSLYSIHYDFPETAIQVICEDMFNQFEKISTLSRNNQINCEAELVLPFTKVEKKFLGDRLGEVEVLERWIHSNPIGRPIDYIGQLPAGSELKDFNEIFQFKIT